MASAESLGYLLLLCSLIFFVFALLGMQLFGGHYAPPSFATPPRASFDDIDRAMLTVFIISLM